MEQVKTLLMRERNITETTANQYIKNLKSLNGKKDFTSLEFLKHTDKLDKIISTYAVSTQKSLYATIGSVSSIIPNKFGYEKTFAFFEKKMAESMKKPVSNKKTEKQEENWLTWQQIINVRNNLEPTIRDSFSIALRWFILCLYTDIPPRRNEDYQYMFVVKKESDAISEDKNYLILNDMNFIFNRYKTSRTYGEQRIAIPKELQKHLLTYLDLHPSSSKEMFPLLVNAEGNAFAQVNSLTQVINSIFGMNIGVSMIRHIYLTDKYSKTVDDMKQDSESMAHSTLQQKAYIIN